MPLDALEPVHHAVTAWANKRSLAIREGILELTESVPTIRVVGFQVEDIELYLGLLERLNDPILVLDLDHFDEEALRLVQGLSRQLQDPKDRRYYGGLIETAASHLGKLQNLVAYAFAGDLSRAVVFRAATDWAAPLFALAEQLADE